MNVNITRLTEYTEDIAAELGALAPQLTDTASDTPVEAQRLQDIIASPFHDQFIAVADGRIIGAATMSITFGALTCRNATLQDFVVDENSRGMGVAGKLWRAICAWSVEQGASKMEFTSRPSREAAHSFYLKHGATVRDTNAFIVTREVLEQYSA